MSKPRAFSYIRFSSMRQLEGDSLRRQTEAAREWCQRQGIELADLTFRDMGISAFRGKNAVEGALGAFVRAVEEGKVRPGDFLLVESLDRLSRDRIMAALNRFHDLLQAGVRVVTLMDGQIYDESSLDNLQGLIVPLAIMSRAHEESATKSKRLRAAWERKKKEAREEGRLFTRSLPAWLRVRDGKIEADPAKAPVVRRIFDMALAGHGVQSIAQIFNQEGVPVFGKSRGWGPTYVKQILTNPAVIGEFQPMRLEHNGDKPVRVPDGPPVAGYFPSVIAESDFYRVKHRRAGVSGKGKTHPPRNALAGLCCCKLCGGAVHFLNKGKGHLYLQCDNAKRKVTDCEAKPLPYWPTFAEIMLALDDFRAYRADNGEAKARAAELDRLAAEIAELEERAENLLDLVEGGNKRAGDRLAALETALEEARSQRRALEERTLAREPAASPDALEGPMARYIMLGEDSEALSPEETAQAVRHINSELKRQLDSVLLARGQPVEFVAKDGTKVTPERKAEIDAKLAQARERFAIRFDGRRLTVEEREEEG